MHTHRITSKTTVPQPRTVNLELLQLVAEKRLSTIQEEIILSLATNLLQEQAA